MTFPCGINSAEVKRNKNIKSTSVNIKKPKDKNNKGEGFSANIKGSKKLKLTVDRVVEYLLRNNLDVKEALLDYKGTTTPLKDFQSRYDWYLFGSGGHSFEKNPNENTRMFQGSSTRITSYAAGIRKMFKSGTSITVSGTGVASNIKGTGSMMMGEQLVTFGGGKGYQHGLQAELEQELLKNFFGRNDRLTEKKLRNIEKMNRQGIKQRLAGLLVEALIGYWTVAVAEQNLKTARENLRSTIDIRNLVARKLRLGLAEREDIMDWGSRVLTGRNNVVRAEKMLFDAKLAVLRTLNLDSGLDIELGQTFKTTPPKVKLEEAMKDAFLKRIDWNNQRIALKNAAIDYRIARQEKMPSLKLKLGLGSQDYDADYFGSYNTINEKYSVSLEATYPLGNTKADVKLRTARLNLQKNHVAMESLQMVIRDEIKSVVKQCRVDYDIYKQTKKSREYAQSYYYQVLTKFRRGRYSALQLKMALDQYMAARQAELKSLVDYNITLIKRDLARNVIFENFTIEIDQILKRVAN